MLKSPQADPPELVTYPGPTLRKRCGGIWGICQEWVAVETYLFVIGVDRWRMGGFTRCAACGHGVNIHRNATAAEVAGRP